VRSFWFLSRKTFEPCLALLTAKSTKAPQRVITMQGPCISRPSCLARRDALRASTARRSTRRFRSACGTESRSRARSPAARQRLATVVEAGGPEPDRGRWSVSGHRADRRRTESGASCPARACRTPRVRALKLQSSPAPALGAIAVPLGAPMSTDTEFNRSSRTGNRWGNYV